MVYTTGEHIEDLERRDIKKSPKGGISVPWHRLTFDGFYAPLCPEAKPYRNNPTVPDLRTGVGHTPQTELGVRCHGDDGPVQGQVGSKVTGAP